MVGYSSHVARSCLTHVTGEDEMGRRAVGKTQQGCGDKFVEKPSS